MAPIFTGSKFGFGRSAAAAASTGATEWTRILNQAGSFPGNTTGSFPTTGYFELLIFAVSGGGAGGAGGNDDGGGGGGGGAGQFTGYPVLLSVAGPYSYSIPGGGAPASQYGGDGSPSPALTVSSPGGTVFSLPGGSGANSDPSNSVGNFGGAGALGSPYSSHPGGTGRVVRGREKDNTGDNGSPGNYGGAGGGGSGTWAGPVGTPTAGNSGLTNTVTSTVTTFGGYPLLIPFSVAGSAGTPGASRLPESGPPTGSPNLPAFGGPSGTYNGGGGAGGGVQFFGTGNSGYGAGGGGGNAQGGTTSGRGGAGYLVVYAR